MLDERDLEIVAALQEDARATYADVAQRVGLSASAVHDRVRKLEHAGVIRGYRAIIDPETVGLFLLREKVGVATRTTIALSIPFEDRPIRT